MRNTSHTRSIPSRTFWTPLIIGGFALFLADSAVAQNCDINRDGNVDISDLAMLTSCFGTTGVPECATSDLDGDGGVDADDLAIWLASCAGPPPVTIDLVAVAVDATELDALGDPNQTRDLKQYLPLEGEVLVTVRNDGNAASGAFEVAVFEDDNRDGVFQPGVPSVEEGQMVAFGSLAAGETRTVSVLFGYAFSQPILGQPPREFYGNRITMSVDPPDGDPNDNIPEINEANNATHSAASITTPDLTVSRIRPRYFRPDHQTPPLSVDFDVRVGNGGNAPAAAGLIVKWYDGDPATGGALVHAQPTQAGLAPGQYEIVNMHFDFPFVFQDSIWVVVDRTNDGGVIDEANETNNEHHWSCFGDINFDNQVSIDDLALLLSNFGRATGAFYTDGDLNSDTSIDLSDLANILGAFGTVCE